MQSFLEVWNNIHEQKYNDDEQYAMRVIRKGLTFAKPGCKDFWESFKELCNDSKGLHTLLGVDPTVISQWSQNIEMYLSKIRSEDSGSVGKQTVIPTGNEPLTATPRDIQGTTEEPRP